MNGVVRGAAAAAAFVVLWQAVVTLGNQPPYILPGPFRVLEALWNNAALIAWHAGITLTEVLAGFALGALLGASTAIGLAVSPAARYLVKPALVATQALPIFALAPILTLWMGYTIWSKIVMTVLIIYFPVASSFFDGLMRTPPGWLDLGQTMGAKPTRLLWRIRVPAALPSLASGLRLSAVYAPMGAVIGEWVGAAGGLGYLMLLANGRVKIDLMFAALLVLAAMTLALHRAVGWGCDRLLTRLD